jgi:DNA-binding transcriptional MerR regulator
MLIGDLAQHSGFSRDTIRYYEKRGLLAHTDIARRANNDRDYGPHALHRLEWIATLKRHGFSLKEIAELLPRFDQVTSCEAIPPILAGKLADIERQLTELDGFRQRLRQALADCAGPECPGPARATSQRAPGEC